MTDLTELGRQILQQQPFSVFLGVELLRFAPGEAVLALNIRPEFRQQDRFVHGGVISFLADNALTFAGGSLLGTRVLTVEFKINYIHPARGARLVARASAAGASRRLAVCRCDVFSLEDAQAQEKLSAAAQGTIALLDG